MSKKFRAKLRERRGFTLAEMVIVLAITTILAGILSVGIYGYLTTAYMTRVNDTAKTVFFAAQNYLMEQKQLGRLDDFNQQAEQSGAHAISEDDIKAIMLQNGMSEADFATYQTKYDFEQISYVTLDPNTADVENNPIYEIVKSYVNDEDLLDHTFLMEYDTETGVVRAVFYTEKEDMLTYDGDYLDRKNVVLRDAESLRDKRQGYYGVELTNLLKDDVSLNAPENVMLINGERLYLQWEESNYVSSQDISEGRIQNANDDFTRHPELKQYLVYDVEICRQIEDGGDGTTGETLFTITGLKASMADGETLADADEVSGDEVRLAYDEDSNTYQLILDDLHHSILDTYGQMPPEGAGATASEIYVANEVQAGDMLYGIVTVRLEGHADYRGEATSPDSNLQSAFYAGGEETVAARVGSTETVDVYGNGHLAEDGSTATEGDAFSIATARHLNNMRYASEDACFVQTADIDWAKPEADRGQSEEFFEPFFFTTQTNALSRVTSNGAFSGTFKNGYEAGDDYVISNLKIDQLSGQNPQKRVGLFRQLAKQGRVEGIHIEDATVQGAYLTGIIAGCNQGTIENVIIEDSRVTAAYYGGGVTGYNFATGVIKGSYVTGTSNTGSTVDVDVSAVLSADRTLFIENIDGAETPDYGWYIGGVAGVNCGTIEQISTGENEVTGTACVGGLTGANTGTATIVKSLNRNRLMTISGGNGRQALECQNFGGIAGLNSKDANIQECESRRLVFLEELTGRLASKNPEYMENVGGIVGENAGTVAASTYTEGTKTAESVDTLTKQVMAAVEKGKLPSYAGVNIGGIAGHNTSTGVITACGSGSVVAGYRNVGGIAGRNQGELNYQDTPLIGKWNNVSEEDCSVNGLVVASDVSAGGIAGTNEQRELKGYQNYANVFAGSLAGGITGANGGMGEYQFTADKAADPQAYYEQLFATNHFSQTNANMRIKECGNFGFIYALDRYAGGIAGINFGVIENMESSVVLSEHIYLSGKDDNYYRSIAKADCVGGIAGANFGTIRGSLMVNYKAGICGADFVGGAVGLNMGSMTNIQKVRGNVYSSGSCVGGIIGLNTNRETMTSIAIADGMQIYGSYFVGGVIGMNVTEKTVDGNAFQITNMITQNEAGVGNIYGTAYVGGILGYNTTLSANTSKASLFYGSGEAAQLIAGAFATYSTNTGTVAQTEQATVYKACINRSNVYAERYLGGIVGYNGEESPLYIIECTNYGAIAVKEDIDASKQVNDGYYFIGGITGRNSTGGVIHKSINDGSVESPSKYLGGICEVNEGYIQFCTVGKPEDYSGTDGGEIGISGDKSVGGLVGLNSNYVVRCTVSRFATVKGGDNTGGLVGTNDVHGVITGDGTKAKSIPGIIEISNAESSAIRSSGKVTGLGNNIGGIVGLNQGQVELVSLTEYANISGFKYVGGFIGCNQGTISSDGSDSAAGDEKVIRNLTNYATVIGYDEVGGIVGAHDATRIENCINFGTIRLVSGQKGNVGGITGSVASNITIANCENHGTVSGDTTGSNAGGITGKNEGTLQNCVHDGMAASNEALAGGIVGRNRGMVENCENSGSVQGAVKVADEIAIGGIAGFNEQKGTVRNCISKKNSMMSNLIRGVGNVGGVIGRNDGALIAETEESKTVSIDITTMDQQDTTNNWNHPPRIGGIVGRIKAGNESLKNFTYTGTITVTAKGASIRQAIGGIVGEIPTNTKVQNCIFAGKIVGQGNAQYSVIGGVGGIAGVSFGQIVVNQNADGIYSACTSNAVVEGRRNIGGLVGLTRKGHQVMIQLPGAQDAVRLEDLPQNNDADTSNDIYYNNLAKVSGLGRVGGCYGHLYEYAEGSQTTMTKVNHYRNRGTVVPTARIAEAHEAIAGIVGSTYYCQTACDFSYLENYGLIGSNSIDDYYTLKTVNYVGGIIGYAGYGSAINFDKVVNYGRISCGQNYIGGLIGKIDGVYKNHIPVPGTNDFTNCANYGTIATRGTCTGGIVGGSSYMTIAGAKNYGMIQIYEGATRVGGILGGTYKNENISAQISITDCSNHAAITYHSATLKTDVRIGGIAGSLNGIVSVTDCENLENIQCVNAGKVGGIVGRLGEADHIVITGCINGENTPNSVIVESQEEAGGIVGTMGSSGKLTFANNYNYGTIYAKYRSGGLVGKVYADNSGWTFKDCTNYGNVYGVLHGALANRNIHEIGGCIGYIRSGVTFENLINEGTIIIDQNQSEKTVDKVLDIGGIVGIAYSSYVNDTILLDCTNCGGIELWNTDANTSYTVADIGGIAGKLEGGTNGKGPIIKSCVNQHEINLSNYDRNVAATVSNVGGIAGYIGAKCKLQYCINEKSVITNTSNGSYIGGIVGESRGLVYSCSTQAPAGEPKGQVVGNIVVGGIVGYANGTGSKLGSIANEQNNGRDVITNTFDVSGEQIVGGIVGELNAATVVGAINDQNTVVTLLGESMNHQYKCAGGIVGHAQRWRAESNWGVIADCYNFGQVRFEAGTDCQYYLGGLVGYRAWSYENGITGVAIKDSFYLHGSGYDKVDESSPLNRASQVLAVGNEPKDKYIADPQDQMFGTLGAPEQETEERFLWTEPAYRKMYEAIHGAEPADSSMWADQNRVREDIIEPYDQYKLPVPETTGITSEKAFEYNLGIKKMPGFCEGLKLYLYDSSVTDEAVAEETGVALLGPISKDVDMDGELSDFPFDVESLKDTHVGQPVKVAIQAIGVAAELDENGELIYTTDSNREVVREFIIMPPLVTPEVEVIEQDGATLTFKISNWDEYQRAAGDIYQSIPQSLQSLAIYQKLLNGLQEFYIEDSYHANALMTSTKATDTWHITQDMIQSDGTFTIDYSTSANFSAYRSAYQYHSWKMNAVATNGDWSLERTEVESGNLYRYTDSKQGAYRFQIKAAVPLNPPTDLAYQYTGGVDIDATLSVEDPDNPGTMITTEPTPSYEISFKRSTSPEEAIAYYLITVTNPANGKTHTYQYVPEPLPEIPESGDGSGTGGSGDGSGTGTVTVDTTCYYTLTKETLLGSGDNQLAVDLDWADAPQNLSWSVQAVRSDSEAAKYFTNSNVVAGTNIALVKKGYPIDNQITIEVENEAAPNLWTYKWSDSHYMAGDAYLVSYCVIASNGSVIYESVREETTNPFLSVNTADTSIYADGNTIEFTVIRKGIGDIADSSRVTRLHSDPMIHQKLIGEKLPTVNSVVTTFDRVEGDNLIYKVEITVPNTLTAENCSGFVISQIVPGNGSVDDAYLGTELTIAYDESLMDANRTMTVEVAVPMADALGKKFYTAVSAKSKLDQSANSENKVGNYIEVPTARLDAPTDVKMIVNTIDPADPTKGYNYDLSVQSTTGDVSFLAGEFEGMTYQLSWELNDVANIAKQHIELLAPADDVSAEPVILWEIDTDQSLENYSLSGVNLYAYAGKTLTLRVMNEPAEGTQNLPSLTTEMTIYVPKVRLETPVFAVDDGSGTVTNVTVRKADGTPVTPDVTVSADEFSGLLYTTSWTNPFTAADTVAGGMAENYKGVRFRMVEVSTSADGTETEIEVTGYNVVWYDGSGNLTGNISMTESYIKLAMASTFGQEPTSTTGYLTMNAIPNTCAGKTLRVYVSYLATDPSVADAVNETYADSWEAVTEFVVPTVIEPIVP